MAWETCTQRNACCATATVASCEFHAAAFWHMSPLLHAIASWCIELMMKRRCIYDQGHRRVGADAGQRSASPSDERLSCTGRLSSRRDRSIGTPWASIFLKSPCGYIGMRCRMQAGGSLASSALRKLAFVFAIACAYIRTLSSLIRRFKLLGRHHGLGLG